MRARVRCLIRAQTTLTTASWTRNGRGSSLGAARAREEVYGCERRREVPARVVEVRIDVING